MTIGRTFYFKLVFGQFDGGAEDHCFPDWADDSNDESCKDFSSDAPLYYEVRQCGGSLKVNLLQIPNNFD